jgi:hypothetical protein
MISQKRTKQATVALTLLLLLTQISACVAPGPAWIMAQANSDTIDICETRATHTMCFQQHAGDFADEMQRFNESLELQSRERWDD